MLIKLLAQWMINGKCTMSVVIKNKIGFKPMSKCSRLRKSVIIVEPYLITSVQIKGVYQQKQSQLYLLKRYSK